MFSAFNDRGDLVFSAIFQDGSHAVLVAAIPEPGIAVVGVVLIGLTAVLVLDAASAGKCSVKVVPRLASDCASSVAPSTSAACRAINNPSPTPPSPDLVSPHTNGENNCSSRSAVIPGP